MLTVNCHLSTTCIGFSTFWEYSMFVIKVVQKYYSFGHPRSTVKNKPSSNTDVVTKTHKGRVFDFMLSQNPLLVFKTNVHHAYSHLLLSTCDVSQSIVVWALQLSLENNSRSLISYSLTSLPKFSSMCFY